MAIVQIAIESDFFHASPPFFDNCRVEKRISSSAPRFQLSKTRYSARHFRFPPEHISRAVWAAHRGPIHAIFPSLKLPPSLPSHSK